MARPGNFFGNFKDFALAFSGISYCLITYGGKLQRIRFKYTGPSIEAVLDRLPTAEIVEQTGDGWIVKAEVFGKGVDMWLKSQGNFIQVMEE